MFFSAGKSILAVSLSLLWAQATLAMEPIVYSVYQTVPMGNEGEIPRKDFYLNVGVGQGVHVGSIVEVFRKISTYDLVGKKLYKEISFPIATLKVIHVEEQVAIARLAQMTPQELTPIQNPQAVMVGDYVRSK